MYRRKKDLLRFVRSGQPMTVRQQVYLAAQLSIPSIFAQISSVIMQYIDASMVGSLGANASASIGLVSTTTWLFMGLCTSVAAGFAVQVAHLLGARDDKGARVVLRQALVLSLLFGFLLAATGCGISGYLPRWLGGDEAIRHDATGYFMIYALSLPALQLNMLAGSMLRCSGNVYVPSILNMLMCVMDVIFNLFLIFPSRMHEIAGFSFYLPGEGLGVEGAALGTALALLVTALLMLYFLCFRSPELGLRHRREKLFFTGDCLRRAFRIGLPMGCERIIMCGAPILSTVIVAPLGIYAIAANAFAITAESLCYMPGYGIADAATTLVGQSLGAKRHDLARSFARITVVMGMAVMTVMGAIMYLAAPLMIGVMTPVPEVVSLGVSILRIEAFAEPMFAAAIVAYGVFIGAGDTLVPATMNFVSIWAVRLTLAALLAPSMGLHGVWIAMCIELCFRGMIFLARMKWGRWIKRL